MECKKIGILDAIKDSDIIIFDDECGVSKISLKDVLITTTQFQTFSSREMFRKDESENFISLTRNLIGFVTEIYKDDMALYVRDPNKKPPRNYWGDSFQMPPGCEQKIKARTITLRLCYNQLRFPGDTYNYVGNRDFDITFEDRKDMLDYKVYQLYDINNADWKHPLLQSIKLNDEYYLWGNGKVKVVKLYDYPNENTGYICQVKTADGETKDIPYDLKDLYYLPYKKIKNPLLALDSNLNELALNPFIVSNALTYNVYWHQVEEAAEYIVSLYKIVNQNNRKNIYHLKDFIVERNTNYLVIDGLINNNVNNSFVIKVSAENRNGEKIAESRGMVRDYPVYMESVFNNNW